MPGRDSTGTVELGFAAGADDPRPRVVVVGGGVIGCAIARELAPAHRVLVLERNEIASGATARAAGEVTMTPSYTDEPAIAAHANEFFRDYDGTGAFEYVETPSIELVFPDREASARARVKRLRDDGVDVSFLDAASLEERWPRLDTTDYVGAVLHRDTGHLDPYTLTTTLQDDAADHGCRFMTGVTVTDVLVKGTPDTSRVTGVETDAGTVQADHVVMAAGWRTQTLLDDIIQLPVRPYRTQCLVLRPTIDLPPSFPMGWIPGEHVYFRPETNGDLLVGGWSFAEDEPERASRHADESFRDHVAELVPRLLRADESLRFVDGWAGIDGATPDTRPIIDIPSDGPGGLVVATGFHGRGVMTAPVAGTLVRCLITGEAPPFPRDQFVLSRFEERSPDFEFYSISAGGE